MHLRMKTPITWVIIHVAPWLSSVVNIRLMNDLLLDLSSLVVDVSHWAHSSIQDNYHIKKIEPNLPAVFINVTLFHHKQK
jgi:hypothetical protein